MKRLVSRAPRPVLAEHPAFLLMLQATMERFHCTLGEVREDYWLGRAWRALTGDPVLRPRVVRVATGSVLVTGISHGPAPVSRRERGTWRMHIQQRLLVDTGHTADQLGVAIVYAEAAVGIAEGRMHSLLAQAIAGDPRWDGLGPFAEDLAPVLVPVASSVAAVAAA
jgi:hypothetical protein